MTLAGRSMVDSHNGTSLLKYAYNAFFHKEIRMAKRGSVEHIAKWRASMQKRWANGSIDRSRCGLPRNKPIDVWKKIDKRGPDECWPYIGGRSTGYGHFRIEGVYYKAHRVVYSLEVEAIDLEAPESNYEKNFILHTCDNRACCNPAHLYRGDIWDNMRDKVERNRCWRGGNRKLNGIPGG